MTVNTEDEVRVCVVISVETRPVESSRCAPVPQEMETRLGGRQNSGSREM